jgi:hypothetical protein
LYTFFVRRHLNRVAQKCQEEARKMLFTPTFNNAHTSAAEIAHLSDLNIVYRRLVCTDVSRMCNVIVLMLRRVLFFTDAYASFSFCFATNVLLLLKTTNRCMPMLLRIFIQAGSIIQYHFVRCVWGVKQ